MRQVALTTTDNPFDPFDQYDQWQAYDMQMGYNTDAYVARVLKTSSELSEEEQNRDYEAAINEIISYNLTGNYKKIVRETSESSA